MIRIGDNRMVPMVITCPHTIPYSVISRAVATDRVWVFPVVNTTANP